MSLKTDAASRQTLGVQCDEEAKKKIGEQIGEQLAAKLGGGKKPASIRVSVFIAHLDQERRMLQDVSTWVDGAIEVLSAIGGGATADKVQGAWVGPNGLMKEPTTVVYSYVRSDALESKMGELRVFLHRYGRETNQGSVGVLIQQPEGDWFFSIEDYDEA